jgi:hypothetical protein
VPTIQSKDIYVEYVVKHNSVYIILLKTCFDYIPSCLLKEMFTLKLYSGPDSSVGIATDYGLGGPGIES